MLIYIDNNNSLTVNELTNCVTDVVDTAATVTVTLKDSSGTEVVGQSWPATMSHISGGTYQITLDDDLVLTANRPYTAIIDATGSGAETGHWEIPLQAMVRTA